MPSGVVPIEAATIDVRSGEAMIVPEMEVPATVLETNISKVGEHLSAAEVGLMSLILPLGVTGESEELVVSGGSYRLYFVIAR